MTTEREHVLETAQTWRGVPYVYGGTSRAGVDCSGYTRAVYATVGVHLPHSSYAQFALVHHVPDSAARPGDLIFLSGLGHVAIYAGPGKMWDAPHTGTTVGEHPIYGSFVTGRLISATTEHRAR